MVIAYSCANVGGTHLTHFAVYGLPMSSRRSSATSGTAQQGLRGGVSCWPQAHQGNCRWHRPSGQSHVAAGSFNREVECAKIAHNGGPNWAPGSPPPVALKTCPLTMRGVG